MPMILSQPVSLGFPLAEYNRRKNNTAPHNFTPYILYTLVLSLSLPPSLYNYPLPANHGTLTFTPKQVAKKRSKLGRDCQSNKPHQASSSSIHGRPLHELPQEPLLLLQRFLLPHPSTPPSLPTLRCPLPRRGCRRRSPSSVPLLLPAAAGSTCAASSSLQHGASIPSAPGGASPPLTHAHAHILPSRCPPARRCRLRFRRRRQRLLLPPAAGDGGRLDDDPCALSALRRPQLRAILLRRPDGRGGRVVHVHGRRRRRSAHRPAGPGNRPPVRQGGGRRGGGGRGVQGGGRAARGGAARVLCDGTDRQAEQRAVLDPDAVADPHRPHPVLLPRLLQDIQQIQQHADAHVGPWFAVPEGPGVPARRPADGDAAAAVLLLRGGVPEQHRPPARQAAQGLPHPPDALQAQARPQALPLPPLRQGLRRQGRLAHPREELRQALVLPLRLRVQAQALPQGPRPGIRTRTRRLRLQRRCRWRRRVRR